MDKLKPILAQKFWILSGLCLIMPLTGWWLATSTMANDFKARKEVLEKAHSGIPSPGPNKNWTERVEALNKEEELKVKQTGDFLWNQQLELMTWPEVVRAGVEKAGYRGEIAAKSRGDYRAAYEQELVDLHKIPKPFDPLTGEGLVDFDISIIPTLAWGQSIISPSSVQMWDSQEDIWLFRALLQAVFNINDQFKCTSIVDSKIKQIQYIELRGGIPGGAKAVADAAGAAGGDMMGGAEGAGAGMPMAGGPGMGRPGGGGDASGLAGLLGGASGGSDGTKASFDPTEQLGSDDVAAPTPEGGGDAGAGAGAMPMPAGPGGPGMMGGMGGGATVKKRYIEETPRYKTRAFYMELVMDHRNLPEFIAELSDSRWPLRVIRVQQVDLDLSDINVANALGGAGPGGGAGMGRPMRGPGGMAGGMPKAAMAGAAGRMPGMPGAGANRPARANVGVPRGGIDGGITGESTVDLQAAMTDPFLVSVALSGVFTLYLPPDAVPAAEGAPAATPGETPAAGDATAAVPATTDPATTDPATAATAEAPRTAEKAADPAAPATAAAPADGQPATETKAATEAKPETEAKPGTETTPAAEKKPAEPPAGTPEPAAKPEAPPAAGAKPESGK